MIKKINLLLVFIAIIGSLYFVFTKDERLVYVLKDLSIILTINALYIIKKLFKLNISDGINFIYILFIFMAHFLGVTVELYNHIYWFDKFTHFLSGVLTGFLAIYILVKYKVDKKITFSFIYIIVFSLAIASFWEIFEYLASYYFNVDPQKVALTGVTDTMGDIIVAFLGAILVSISYYFEYKENHTFIVKRFINNI